jgi:hypothetical protein
VCRSEFVEVCSKFCWWAMNGSLAYFVKDLPAYEDEYSLDGCLAETWASK